MLTLLGCTRPRRETRADASSVRSRGMRNSDVRNEGCRNNVAGASPSRTPPTQNGEPFRLLVESVKDYALITLDPSGRVVSWNPGAERIKGYSSDEIIGRSFEVFYPKETVVREFPRHELDIAAREGRFEDEGWRVRKDGSRFWANVIITALRNGEGRLVGFAKITRDLTARREAEEQARRLAAEQAARAAADRRSEELERLNERLECALEEARTARDEARHSAAATELAYRDLDQFAYVAS